MHRSLATRVLKGIYWFILKALYRFKQAWKLRLSLVQRAFYMSDAKLSSDRSNADGKEGADEKGCNN